MRLDINGFRGSGSGADRACPIATCRIAMRDNLTASTAATNSETSLRTVVTHIVGSERTATTSSFGVSLGDKESIKAEHGYFPDDDLSGFDPSFSMTKEPQHPGNHTGGTWPLHDCQPCLVQIRPSWARVQCNFSPTVASVWILDVANTGFRYV